MRNGSSWSAVWWIRLVSQLDGNVLFYADLFYVGSFSLAKNLEWRLKQGINSGLNSGAKETTVLPPQDYHERFVKAIESYFLACPGMSV